MPPLPEKFWQYITSALLAGLLAILTISWQASRHEHEAIGQMTEWTNKTQDGRITVLETRQEDVRNRLATLENKYTYETLVAIAELRKRLDRIEGRLYSMPSPSP